MIKLFSIGQQLQKDKSPFVINLIIKKEGSSPRETGAWMIVDGEGLKAGTIGGGMLEFQAIEKSKELIKLKKSTTEKYILNDDVAKNMGMVCGGNNTVLFLYVDPSNLELENIFEIVLSNFKDKFVELVIGTSNLGLNLNINGELMASYGEITPEEDTVKFSILDKKKMFVFGGGHIAQCLVPILNDLEFETIVIEDREEFLLEEQFPQSLRILSQDYSTANLDISIHDYVCILTRGHKHDRSVLFEVLEKNPKYIGVIGSKKKAAILFSELENSKYAYLKDKIFSPIGMKINAETPFEIAISIASEIIQDYRSSDESSKRI
ncbi:MAG: XdhC family protein [Neofamilia sp.]